MTTLGETIRAARTAAGVSVAELAGRIGVHQQTLYKWERDGATPSVESLKAIAVALDAPLSIKFGVHHE